MLHVKLTVLKNHVQTRHQDIVPHTNPNLWKKQT